MAGLGTGDRWREARFHMSLGPMFVVAILAGGEGSRIGGGKPLLELGGRTLMELAFNRATGWSEHAVIAVRSADQIGSLEAPCITDVEGIEGPLAGLASSLQWARRQGAAALLSLACDMPFLPDDLPSRLVHAIGGRNAAVASSGGHLHPVCTLWRSEALDDLADYCASGRKSLKGFAEHVGYTSVEWPVRPYDPFFNINRPKDLAFARTMIRR